MNPKLIGGVVGAVVVVTGLYIWGRRKQNKDVKSILDSVSKEKLSDVLTNVKEKLKKAS